jgi:hypothetical protein
MTTRPLLVILRAAKRHRRIHYAGYIPAFTGMTGGCNKSLTLPAFRGSQADISGHVANGGAIPVLPFLRPDSYNSDMELIDLQNIPPEKDDFPFPYDWADPAAQEAAAKMPPLLKHVRPVGAYSPNRKSTRLGLSFPYDWANSKMDDDALIYHVLERGIFKDICRVCRHFGIDRVEAMFHKLPDNNPLLFKSLTRTLGNIRIGLSHAKS